METKSYQTDRPKRKAVPESKERLERRDFNGDELLSKGTLFLAAMLSAADSAECSQTAGNAVLEAAGSVGNSALLRTLEAENGHSERVSAASDILGADGTGLVPEWAEDVPENEFTSDGAFSAAEVPEFVFSGGAAVDFSAAESLAQDFAQ